MKGKARNAKEDAGYEEEPAANKGEEEDAPWDVHVKYLQEWCLISVPYVRSCQQASTTCRLSKGRRALGERVSSGQ